MMLRYKDDTSEKLGDLNFMLYGEPKREAFFWMALKKKMWEQLDQSCQ